MRAQTGPWRIPFLYMKAPKESAKKTAPLRAHGKTKRESKKQKTLTITVRVFL